MVLAVVRHPLLRTICDLGWIWVDMSRWGVISVVLVAMGAPFAHDLRFCWVWPDCERVRCWRGVGVILVWDLRTMETLASGWVRGCADETWALGCLRVFEGVRGFM